MYKTRSMEDEILKIMAAEIAGENVTKEEREKMNRWWEEKRGNERTYKMLMGELGEVVRLVNSKEGWIGRRPTRGWRAISGRK